MAPYEEATERPLTADKEPAPVSSEKEAIPSHDGKEAIVDQSPKEKHSLDIEKEAVTSDDIVMQSAPEAILKHGLDADEALKAFIGHEGEQIVLDEVTNRRLVRKIDLHILPVGLYRYAHLESRAHPLSRLCVLYMGSTIWTVSQPQLAVHFPVYLFGRSKSGQAMKKTNGTLQYWSAPCMHD